MAFIQSRHSSRITLSPSEMLKISEQLSREYTPNFSNQALTDNPHVRLSSHEMLSISEEISREYAVHPAQRPPQSKIVLMPVDPEHLHAYWHIDERQIGNENSERLTLRLYSMPDREATADYRPDWLDVAVEAAQSQKKVAVPQFMSGHYYSAAIGRVSDKESFTAYARSDIAYIPRIYDVFYKLPLIETGGDNLLVDFTSGRGKRLP